ncbi:type II secretion system protein J [Candidatus Margulisiibacteriota bacterium]
MKINNSRSKKGLLLIEFLIALTIIFSLLPITYSSFIRIQKQIIQTYQIQNKEVELGYILHLIRKDLKQCESFVVCQNNLILGTNINDGSKVKFYCEKGLLKRSIQRLGKNPQVAILNKIIKIPSFTIKNYAARLLELSINTERGEKEIAIFLQNEKN